MSHKKDARLLWVKDLYSYLSVAFMYLSRKSFCFLSKKSSRANEQSPASFIVGKRTDIGVLSVMGRRHNSFGTVIPPKFVAQTGRK